MSGYNYNAVSLTEYATLKEYEICNRSTQCNK